MVYYKADIIIISLKINLFSQWYICKNCWVGVTQQSLTHSLVINLCCKRNKLRIIYYLQLLLNKIVSEYLEVLAA